MNNKSKILARRKRGQINKSDLDGFKNYNIEELINLMNNEEPWKRTVAITLLDEKNEESAVKYLAEKFQDEDALYTRIAISKALANFGEIAVPYLIDLLGKIGNNQEKTLPKKYFNKKSFPLPRDLAARTLSNLGKVSTTYLIELLNKDSSNKEDIFIKEQAIDAVGRIASKYDDHRALDSLKILSKKHKTCEIIQWKIARALSGFKKNEKALNLLFNIINEKPPVQIKWEIVRSVGQIGIFNEKTNKLLNSIDENNPNLIKSINIAKKEIKKEKL